MLQVIQAQILNIINLEKKIGFRLASNDQFFPECFNNLAEISGLEKQYLDRVKTNYLSLVKRRPISEEMVKMVVLSPLLDLADFYHPPFYVKTEDSLEITLEDEGEIRRGRIDVLVLKP